MVLGEHGKSDMLAVVRLEDLLNLLSAAHGETNPPILVGQGEDDYEKD